MQLLPRQCRREHGLPRLENEDALQVLSAVGLHPPALDDLREVAERIARAAGSSRQARIAELREVRRLIERARSRMVV